MAVVGNDPCTVYAPFGFAKRGFLFSGPFAMIVSSSLPDPQLLLEAGKGVIAAVVG